MFVVLFCIGSIVVRCVCLRRFCLYINVVLYGMFVCSEFGEGTMGCYGEGCF